MFELGSLLIWPNPVVLNCKLCLNQASVFVVHEESLTIFDFYFSISSFYFDNFKLVNQALKGKLNMQINACIYVAFILK